MEDFRDKTCESCYYRIDGYCRRFPYQFKEDSNKLCSLDFPTVNKISLACGEYKNRDASEQER